MKLTWRKSESTVYPQPVERIKSGVLLHDNVEETEVGDGDEKVTMYVYDEAYLKTAEYAQYLAEQNKADIDYICMETGVEL